MVPGPRIVNVAETMAELVSRCAVSMTGPILGVRTSAGVSAARAILRDVGFDVAPGEFVGNHGPQRRRQEHAARYHRRSSDADVRAKCSWRIGPLDEWSSIERARFLAHLPQSFEPTWRCAPKRWS